MLMRQAVDNFKMCLFADKEDYRETNFIKVYKHELYSIKMNKLVLSPKDDNNMSCIIQK